MHYGYEIVIRSLGETYFLFGSSRISVRPNSKCSSDAKIHSTRERSYVGGKVIWNNYCAVSSIVKFDKSHGYAKKDFISCSAANHCRSMLKRIAS